MMQGVQATGDQSVVKSGAAAREGEHMSPDDGVMMDDQVVNPGRADEQDGVRVIASMPEKPDHSGDRDHDQLGGLLSAASTPGVASTVESEAGLQLHEVEIASLGDSVLLSAGGTSPGTPPAGAGDSSSSGVSTGGEVLENDGLVVENGVEAGDMVAGVTAAPHLLPEPLPGSSGAGEEVIVAQVGPGDSCSGEDSSPSDPLIGDLNP